MSKLVAVAQLALCFVAVLCISSSGQNHPPEFVGKWILVDGEFSDGLDGDMELLSDGTGFVESTDKYKQRTVNVDCTWKIVDKRIVISANVMGTSTSVLYYYKLSGYELMLNDDEEIGDDGGYGALYVRKENLKDYEKKQEAELGEILKSGYVLFEKGKHKEAVFNFNRVLKESKDSEKIKKAKEGIERVQKAPEEAKKAETKKVADKAKASISTFKDSRDGKTYKKVTIGNQTWTAENLNYATKKGSKCFGGKEDNCVKYGRLYTWAAAKEACPAGWHLPSETEWVTLLTNAGDDKSVPTKLKSKSGWDSNGNGTDNFGFSALPGGYDDGLHKNYLGQVGFWWFDPPTGDDVGMSLGEGIGVIGKQPIGSYKYSVRCVQN